MLVVALVAGCSPAGAAGAPGTATPAAIAVGGVATPTAAPPAALASPSALPSATAAQPVVDTPAATPSVSPRPGVDPSAPPRPDVPSATSPSPRPSVSLEPSLPPRESFAINLAEPSDFVAQYTLEWCVGASIQMTLAMTGESGDMSRARQQRVWEMARDRSSSPFGGANPRGWVATLNDLDVGPYRLVSLPTLEDALSTAARALSETGRPVGLVMWRGRHAWVMSGFTSVGDPSIHTEFEVTGVNVLDPLYPRGSRTWGPSPKPGSLLTPEVLGRQFVPRPNRRVNLGVPPGYLLVLPVAA